MSTLWSPSMPANAKVYSRLSEETLTGFEDLAALADEVWAYYEASKDKCEAM